jgi:hypothetical protein
MSFWPKPIMHLDRPQGDDPNMIIINKCDICWQWYHFSYVVVTNCLHIYHLACFGSTLRPTTYARVVIKYYTLIGGLDVASKTLTKT